MRDIAEGTVRSGIIVARHILRYLNYHMSR